MLDSPNLSQSIAPNLPKLPNFCVVLDQTYSLRDIQHLNAAGYSVIRSAHAGNLSNHNLAIAAAGIPVLLHETLMSNDPVYEPGKLIKEGKSIDLCIPTSKLALWQTILSIPELSQFASPIHLHIAECQRHWKNTMPLSVHITRIDAPLLEALITRFMQIDPLVAHAYVDSTGQRHAPITPEFPGTQQTLEMIIRHFSMTSACITQNRPPEATIIPDTAAMIVLSTIADLLNPSKRYISSRSYPANVFHLAGAQMTNYLAKDRSQSAQYLDRIEILYKAAKEIIPALPEQVVFHLIPTSHLQCTMNEDQNIMAEQLLQAAAKLKNFRLQLSAENGRHMQSLRSQVEDLTTGRDFNHFIDWAKQEIPEFEAHIAQAPKKFNEELFSSNQTRAKKHLLGVIAKCTKSDQSKSVSEERDLCLAQIRLLKQRGCWDWPHITQYDLAASGGKVHICPSMYCINERDFRALQTIIDKAPV